jgi:hypothetical protein
LVVFLKTAQILTTLMIQRSILDQLLAHFDMGVLYRWIGSNSNSNILQFKYTPLQKINWTQKIALFIWKTIERTTHQFDKKNDKKNSTQPIDGTLPDQYSPSH